MKSFLRSRMFGVLVLAAAVLAVYGHTMTYPFHFDDYFHFVDNDAVRNPSLVFDWEALDGADIHQNIKAALKTRTLGYLSFALNLHGGGVDPIGYHVFNILIHAANALLVYFIILAFFRSAGFSNASVLQGNIWALIVALVFAVHPVQTQAVTYLSQRFSSLAAFFCLAAMYCYMQSRVSERRALWWLIAATVSMAAGMKVKEYTVTFPLVIAAYEFLFHRGRWKHRVLWLAPIALTMAITPVTILLSSMPLSETLNLGHYRPVTRVVYFMTQIPVVVTYLRLLVVPYDQNLDYDYPLVTNFTDPAFLLSLALVVSIAAIPLLFQRGSVFRPVAIWGIAWFCIVLSVESSFLPLDDVINEHRLYLPSVGFMVALSAVAAELMGRVPGENRRKQILLASCSFICVIALAVAAHVRNTVWQSSITLWKDVAEKSPGKERPYVNLCAEYMKSGDTVSALFYCSKANELDPLDAIPKYYMGVLMLHSGDVLGAKDKFLNVSRTGDAAANKYNPYYFYAMLELANILYREGDFNAARAYYQQILESGYKTAEAHFNLGIVYEKLADKAAARAAYDSFLKRATERHVDMVPRAKSALERLGR